MNLFLVLEGVDGAGKTTIANGLVKRMNGEYFRTPGKEYQSIRAYIDGNVPEAKLFFYLSSVFDVSERIRKAVQEHPTICDRYIWSSLITHAAFYGEELNVLEHLPLISRLTPPTQTILLEVSDEEQLARIGKRGKTPSTSDELCFDNVLRSRVKSLYRHVAQRDRWIMVNAENRSVDDVLDEIERKCDGGFYGSR